MAQCIAKIFLGRTMRKLSLKDEEVDDETLCSSESSNQAFKSQRSMVVLREEHHPQVMGHKRNGTTIYTIDTR